MAVLETSTLAAIDAALECLVPSLMRRGAGMEVAALARAALTGRPQAVLTLHAAPATLAAVATELADEAASGRLTLLADPELSDGAAAISWQGGGLDFDPCDLLRRVRTTLCPTEEHPT